MSFRLLIECSKAIDELHINFSDGTSSIVSKDDNEYQKPKEHREQKENREHKQYPKVKPKEEKENRRTLDTYLDTEDDVVQTKQEKIQLPVIPDKESFKVADELQNLDI